MIVVSAFVTNVLAQTLPEGFVLVDVGGSDPKIPVLTSLAFAPDGRIFVTAQAGQVWIIKNDILLEDPFFTLTTNDSYERGLTGIAIDPEFSVNHYVYLNYTTPDAPLHNRVIRVTADGDHVVSGSETTILDLDNVPSPNHVAGAMNFGLDGKLYIATGDNLNSLNSQDLDTYHGKILRINKDGSAPADNPFPTGSEQRKRVWAYGLRNPYSLGFHPVTGKIFANDVGQSQFEEINDATAPGLNFGWPETEGATVNPVYTTPIYAYHHGTTTPSGCAITGGDFLHGGATNYPSQYVEKYFFVDLCSNWLYYMDPSLPTSEPVLFSPAIGGEKLYLTTGPDGNLYFLSHSSKMVHKLVYSQTGEPIVTTQPISQSISKEEPVTFSLAVAGNMPMEYQWYKDDIEIEGATTGTYTIPVVDYDDVGAYSVVATNNAGSATSSKAQLSVGPPNERPAANILLPTGIENYVGGGTIQFSGEASDPEDDDLPTEAFQWYINFHHDTHYHDQPPVVGKTGTFEVPVRGETSTNVWYRFILKVTDSHGGVGLDTVDVHPVISQLTFTSNPPGAQITIDGQPVNTPHIIKSVSGVVRDLHAIEPQVIDGIQYVFASWSQGGDALQSITTPDVDTEYVVTFAPNEPPVPNILLPTGTEKYAGGGTVQFSGEATDPEDVDLPEEAFQWYINFHHDGQYQNLPPVVGKTGTFEVPTHGETSSNVWYRFILKVTDSHGREGVDSIDVYPVVSQLIFTSDPPGAQITIDGQLVNTPHTITGVSGVIRDLHALEEQEIDGTRLLFASWSQGGGAVQSITTPDVDTEYVVTFAPNQPPVPNILLPTGTEKYVGGGTVQFSGEASDPEDGNLPEEAFQWYINFHHHDGQYQNLPPVVGKTGTFEVPIHGDTSSNAWYRFILKVTDSHGREGVASIDVYPVVVQLTFTSDPPGAQITIDGHPVRTPHTITTASGVVRGLHAIEPQVVDGIPYVFASWSQGGEALQSIITPDTDTEYIATFAPILGSEDDKTVHIYPTIARNEVFVAWNAADPAPEILITDIYGRSYEMPVSRTADELIVKVRNLPPAVYVLSCIGSTKKFKAKFMIVR